MGLGRELPGRQWRGVWIARGASLLKEEFVAGFVVRPDTVAGGATSAIAPPPVISSVTVVLKQAEHTRGRIARIAKSTLITLLLSAIPRSNYLRCRVTVVSPLALRSSCHMGCSTALN
jgi:hypothetical protein